MKYVSVKLCNKRFLQTVSIKQKLVHVQLNVLEKPCDRVTACPTDFHDISDPHLG